MSYLNRQDHNGFTCSIEAPIEGDIRLVRALLSYEGINAGLQLKGRDTALDYSCIHGNPAITKLLLNEGAPQLHLYFPGRRNDRECMRLVEEALSQATRVHLLYKARVINDASYAVEKVYNGATNASVEKRKRKSAASAPLYLRDRVRMDQELPLVIGRGDEREMAVAEYVLSDRLPREVLIESMDMMLPKWRCRKEETMMQDNSR